MLNKKKYTVTTIAGWTSLLLLLGGVFALLYYSKAEVIPFKSFTESNVLAIITSMFVVSVFMERSVEAILIPVRATGRQKIEQDLADIQKQEGLNHNSTNDSRDNHDNNKDKLQSKVYELQAYKLETARRAFWISYAFGLIISLVGVRTLAGLVDAKALADLGEIQRILFPFVDIVLTGGVIAGGSAAIDKIGREISRVFKLNSAIDPKPLE